MANVIVTRTGRARERAGPGRAVGGVDARARRGRRTFRPRRSRGWRGAVRAARPEPRDRRRHRDAGGAGGGARRGRQSAQLPWPATSARHCVSTARHERRRDVASFSRSAAAWPARWKPAVSTCWSCTARTPCTPLPRGPGSRAPWARCLSRSRFAVMDETAEPATRAARRAHPLETLGDAEPARGVYAIMQPAMQHGADVRLAPRGRNPDRGRQGGRVGTHRCPRPGSDYVQARWRPTASRASVPAATSRRSGATRCRNGGIWEDVAPAVRRATKPAVNFAARCGRPATWR